MGNEKLQDGKSSNDNTRNNNCKKIITVSICKSGIMCSISILLSLRDLQGCILTHAEIQTIQQTTIRKKYLI